MAENLFKADSEHGVVDYLIEMRRISELIVELAYSALLLEDKEIADDVIEMEKRMNELKYELESKTVMSRLPPREAVGMVAILELAHSSSQIAAAASYIVGPIRKGIKRHPLIKSALSKGKASLYKKIVHKDSIAKGKTLAELNVADIAGMHLIALKKHGIWTTQPNTAEKLELNDVLLLSGPGQNAKLLDKII